MSLGVVSIGGPRGIGARPTHGALPKRILLFHIGTITAPHKASSLLNAFEHRITYLCSRKSPSTFLPLSRYVGGS